MLYKVARSCYPLTVYIDKGSTYVGGEVDTAFISRERGDRKVIAGEITLQWQLGLLVKVKRVRRRGGGLLPICAQHVEVTVA